MMLARSRQHPVHGQAWNMFTIVLTYELETIGMKKRNDRQRQRWCRLPLQSRRSSRTEHMENAYHSIYPVSLLL
jgi:hypothetical protein